MHDLPDRAHLAYAVIHEQWPEFANRPEINIQATKPDGESAWNFSVTEYQINGRRAGIEAAVLDDSFAAYTQIPEFFAALGDEEVRTLDAVVRLLGRMGAADETERGSRRERGLRNDR